MEGRGARAVGPTRWASQTTRPHSSDDSDEGRRHHPAASPRAPAPRSRLLRPALIVPVPSAVAASRWVVEARRPTHPRDQRDPHRGQGLSVIDRQDHGQARSLGRATLRLIPADRSLRARTQSPAPASAPALRPRPPRAAHRSPVHSTQTVCVPRTTAFFNSLPTIARARRAQGCSWSRRARRLR